MSARSEISGDVPLGAADKLRYLAHNAWRNLSVFGARWRPYRVSPAIAARSVGQSPSRLLTECFLAEMLPKLLPARPIEVLEIGCGSGSMVKRLSGLGVSGHYIGLDIGNSFSADKEPVPGFTVGFRQVDAHLYAPSSPIDLMISVSALEHIPDDARLVARLSGAMNAGGVQVHVVPSAAALWTYLWHGYRQYTPRSLADRFGQSDVEIYGLGGFGTFILHLLAVTPEIAVGSYLRKRSPGLYSRVMGLALRIDRWLPFCPTAHVVVKRHGGPTQVTS